jgi:hypothetical protein
MGRKRPQALVFSYHKTGTTMFFRVMEKVSAHLTLKLQNIYGMVRQIDSAADIVLLPHSLLGFTPTPPIRGVRIVRDPRDIWVSSYLYHLRTREEWCTNTDFDLSPPILYPRVDYSIQHRSEEWKRSWLTRLAGKSYQQNLRDRDRADGLEFELNGYTDCTLTVMRGWWFTVPEVLDVKLEDIMQDFDSWMRTIFRHLQFSDAECEAAAELAAEQDIRRMSDDVLEANEFIYSRQISKWPDILTATQVCEFQRRYGDLITRLGYELA